MSAFLLSVAAGVVTALVIATARLVIAIAREVRRVSSTVTESASATAELTQTVARLQAHDAQNRERIAALWARVFPSPSPSQWSNQNANARPGHHARPL